MGNQRQIGQIQLFAKLKDGPITDVYKGYQTSLQRYVLVKVLRAEFENDQPLVQRFLNEARGTARVQHPNVVAMYEYGESEGRHYFAAEFVDGPDLQRLLQQRAVPPKFAWFILLEMAKGLKAAHGKKVIHRDIKPANVLISNAGEVKLVDFGMSDLEGAAAASAAEIKGTEHYFAPEQILGQEVGPSSDIFALGATFYEMLAGVKPFRGEDPGQLFKAIVEEDPVAYLKSVTTLPAAFVPVCATMLAKPRADRYSDCDVVLAALKTLATDTGIVVGQSEFAAFLASAEADNAADFAIPPAAPDIRKRSASVAGKYGVAFLLTFVAFLIWQIGFSGGNKGSAPETGVSVTDTIAQKSREEAAEPDAQPTTAEVLKPVVAGYEANGRITPPAVGKPESSRGHTVEPVSGWLEITCAPWAAVFVDGDSVGTTPVQGRLAIPAGAHRIELKNPEFPDYREIVEVAPDSATILSISLLEMVATLTLDVHPWAEVHIDGVYRETLPPQKRPFFLLPGEHRLLLKHPVLGQWQTSINLQAGDVIQRRYNLITLLKQ